MSDLKEDKVNSDGKTQSDEEHLETENTIQSSTSENEKAMKFQETTKVEQFLESSEDAHRTNLSEETECDPLTAFSDEVSKITDFSTSGQRIKSTDTDSERTKKEKFLEQPKLTDYDSLTLEELTDELEKTVATQRIKHIKSTVEIIKSTFDAKFRKLQAEKKAVFLEDGGNPIDFEFSSPIKSKYDKLLVSYKKSRDAHYSKLEKQLKENLQKRIQVIERLKSLIENSDAKTMYESFRQLQNTWKAIGPVSKTKYNDTWKIYHHHVERFYDLLHLSNDLRDLDFKKNLEKKTGLVQKAEALAGEKDINLAFKKLQELHRLWKEETGPVAREIREEIWGKFKAATKVIQDRKHHHSKELRSQYGKIIKIKLAVVEEIRNYDTSENKTHNDWQKSIRHIEDLRGKYFDAGKLPYSKSEPVWTSFKDATKRFNQEKNKFYKKEKNIQQENLRAKLELVDLAESLKDSEDWKNATVTFKRIQSDWKKIGRVPRKFSDNLWKKFKAACNHYFDRYYDQKNSLSPAQKEIYDKKLAFFQGIKAEDCLTKESVTHLMYQWNQLGRIPRGSEGVDIKFNKFIDSVLSKISIPKEEVLLLKFKNSINGYLANNELRKLDSEQMLIRKKVEETTREIQQLENNLSFFSSASENSPFVKTVQKNIDGFKKGLKIWENKLAYLQSLEYG